MNLWHYSSRTTGETRPVCRRGDLKELGYVDE